MKVNFGAKLYNIEFLHVRYRDLPVLYRQNAQEVYGSAAIKLQTVIRAQSLLLRPPRLGKNMMSPMA